MTNPLQQARELRTGEIEILGRMPYSSNATFLVAVGHGGMRAIYKPERGERPLWDFPPGLWKGEVAAHVLDLAIGWEVIPPTVERDDAPLEVGSLQLFIDADFSQHYFTLVSEPSTHPQLQRMCVFDLIANNTDRKSGQCLIDGDGHIWGIDNGLAFAAQAKLRTVIWDFEGEPVPEEILADVSDFLDAPLPDKLTTLLDPFERDAITARARAVLQVRRFPVDHTGHGYPWPLV